MIIGNVIVMILFQYCRTLGILECWGKLQAQLANQQRSVESF
jgi:hypothetical protein